MLVKRLAVYIYIYIYIRNFSTFIAHFGLPMYAPGTIAVNITRIEREFMLVKRLAACTHLSSTVSEI